MKKLLVSDFSILSQVMKNKLVFLFNQYRKKAKHLRLAIIPVGTIYCLKSRGHRDLIP